MTVSLLDAALAYASIGWHVFPIREDTKQPATPHGHLDATTDPDRIRAWWASNPDARIGVYLRASGLIAIDVDVADGRQGAAEFAALEAAHGPLPRNLVQQSGRGGLHVIMADPSPGSDGWTRPQAAGGELRGKLSPAVDVKCNGYIVLCPSGRYTWLSSSLPPAPVPEAFKSILRKPDASHEQSDTPADWSASSDGPLDPRDADELRAALRAKPRDGASTGAVFNAIALIFHHYGLSVEEGWPYLLEWNSICPEPHTLATLQTQISKIARERHYELTGLRGYARRAGFDVWARCARSPATLPRGPAPVQATTAPVDPVALVAALPAPPPPPAADSFEAGLLRALGEVRAALGRAEVQGFPAALFEPAGGLFGRSFPATPWLVRDLITAGGVGAVATEPKAGKTWVATEIALATASGTRAFGRYDTARTVVAYFFAEDMAQQVRNRLRALCATRGGDAADLCRGLHVQPRGRNLDLTRDEDAALLVASCRALGQIGLLVLDPMRDVHSGAEDSSDEMRVVMLRLRVVAELVGCTVLFVHHSGKDGADTRKRRSGQKMRGSSAIHGSVDFGIYLGDLSGDGESVFTNHVESEVKGARGAGHFDLTLRVTDDANGEAVRADWSWDRASKEEKASRAAADQESRVLAVVKKTPGLTVENLANRLGGRLSEARRIIKSLLDGGSLQMIDENAGQYDPVTGRPVKRREVIVLPGATGKAQAEADLPPLVSGEIGPTLARIVEVQPGGLK